MTVTTQTRGGKPQVYEAIAAYMRSSVSKAAWQIINTLVPYFALWVAMIFTVLQGLPYWVTLPLAVLAAGLHIRIFIIFHDCTHGSFFDSARANRIMGYISGVLTFTPFEQWRRSHAVHHATVGDLDRRGTGDVWTLTVAEYKAASWPVRLFYRIYRNPLIMLGLGPTIIFLFAHRIPHRDSKRIEQYSVIFTDLALIALIGLASLTIGFKTYVMIQLPILVISGAAGVWMFYVQHQFEGSYWARHDEWNPLQAALDGSSYYKLPKLLQWFTGSIGLHHIHHVQPRIPNYNLQSCSDGVPELHVEQPLTFRRSLRSLSMNLWDEAQEKFVSFRSLSKQPQTS